MNINEFAQILCVCPQEHSWLRGSAQVIFINEWMSERRKEGGSEVTTGVELNKETPDQENRISGRDGDLSFQQHNHLG